LIDPSVFADLGSGTLPAKPLRPLREHGPDVRRSSDLDLKILVREGGFSPQEQARLERQLGERIDAASPFMPLSGHPEPRHRLHPVAKRCADARAAFLDYNRRRPARAGKGPHSREAAVLRFDPAHPATGLASDARQAVRDTLPLRRERARRVELEALGLNMQLTLSQRGARLRARLRELSLHQLIGALRDFPDREPGGLRLSARGELRGDALAAWAAAEAGRTEVELD
jgi:hypothetical protein